MTARRHVPAEIIKAMGKMREDGESYRAIGQKFGFSHRTVVYHTTPHLRRAHRKPARDIEISEEEREDGGNRRPHHLETYHQTRRGFHVPDHLADDYHGLVRKGVPIVEAARQLGLLGSAGS